MDEILKDERFKHIAQDPRFRRIPRSQKKIKIDKRFQSMFEDKRFKLKYTVDKRGRPINRTTNEDLQKFYHLESDSEDEESNSDEEKDVKDSRDTKLKSLKRGKKTLKQQRNIEDIPGTSREFSKLDKIKVAKAKSSSKKSNIGTKKDSQSEEVDDKEVSDEGEENETEESGKHEDDEDSSEGMRSDDETVTDDVKTKLKDLSVDYARGEGALLSDSSSDELTEDEEGNYTSPITNYKPKPTANPDEESDLDHGWGELDRDAERVEESTRRLALCNMDWDRIRATDIMVLLNSFVPAGGLINSVTVYPSEYGMERMKKEREKGPLELYGEKEGSEEDEEDRDDKKYHMEKLRQYQLNRLKYFYAVIECDTVATADHLYKECDGREYESSATRLDLRFIPDDTDFDQEPREKCSEMPDIRKYKPRSFLTTALQQSKVDMTWDETDPDRAALTSRVAAGDIDDDDLKAYLASSTEKESEESEEDEVEINKYKNLCKGNEKKDTNEDEESEEEGGDQNNAESDEEERGGEREGDDDDSDDDAIAKYRRALQSNAEEEEEGENKGIEMEVTWDVGLQKAAEEAVKKKMEEKEERTPFEEMMHRRREKKKEKQRKKVQEKGDESGDSDESDDYVPADVDLNDSYFKEEYDKLDKEKKKKKKKNIEETEEDAERKKWAQLNSVKKARQKKTRRELEEEAAKESNFQVDVNDDRFSALYTSHLFNIDPTDPNFRKTSGVAALINEKLDRRSKEPIKQPTSEPPKKKVKIENGDSERTAESLELSALVEAVKSKAQSSQNLKKRKQQGIK